MLKLLDLIELAGVEIGAFKIHCATGPPPGSGNWQYVLPRMDVPKSPLEAFFVGKFKIWQEAQNQPNFGKPYIVSLIDLRKSKWLFAGVYEVHGLTQRTVKGKVRYRYKTTLLNGLEHLVGRVGVRFEKKFRAAYLLGTKFGDKLEVAYILEKRMTIGDFPGFDQIRLSLNELRTVIRENNASWKGALSKVAGVYLVTDISSGKLYVGSAYGGDGIWKRWAIYTKNGHGGNKELRALLNTKGAEHAANFQFTMLEVCDLKASNEYVCGRETHWKKVLCSREFGLNEN